MKLSKGKVLGPSPISRLAPAVAAAVAAFAAAPALHAQTASATQGTLEEIIVTATKRAESVQSIAVSVSALSEEELENRGASEFFDFALSIPNLSFGAATDGVLSSRSISLRGISGVNTTGVYIDDTPISETIDPRILALERIEVLRGPTGTLYGARSLGGTIRYITRKPDFSGFDGQVRASLSGTDESGGTNYGASASFNIPLGDRAGVLLSLLSDDRAGVFDRAVGPIADHLGQPATLASPASASVTEDVDSQSVRAYRASFLFQPTQSLTIEPRVTHQTTNLDGFPLADVRPDNFAQNRDFNTPEGGEDEWTLFSLNVNYDSPAGSFVSATSVFNRDTFEFEESGSFINFLQALPAAAGGFGLRDARGDQFTPLSSPIYQTLNFETTVQEFRFSSDLSGGVNYVAGLFYQQVRDDEDFRPRNFAPGLAAEFGAIGAPWPFGDLVFTSERPSETEELGAFGELDYAVNDRFAATLGLRWYQTEYDFSNRQAGLAVQLPLADDAPISSVPAATGSQKEDGVIFKASMDYQARENLFLYGKVAQGFRIGGANGPVPNSLGCPANLASLNLGSLNTATYDSDELISYEIGVKSGFSDRLRINAAAFLIDFDNIQQAVQLGCGFQFRANFGAARSSGFEFELNARPNDSLSLGLSYGRTNADFTESVGSAINQQGDPLQFVPDVTASFNLEYTAAGFLPKADLYLRFDYSHVGESLSQVNSQRRVREAYEQASLRAELRTGDWAVGLFADNLTNDIANLADNRSLAAETPGRPRWVVSRPRTIGLSFSYDF